MMNEHTNKQSVATLMRCLSHPVIVAELFHIPWTFAPPFILFMEILLSAMSTGLVAGGFDGLIYLGASALMAVSLFTGLYVWDQESGFFRGLRGSKKKLATLAISALGHLLVLGTAMFLLFIRSWPESATPYPAILGAVAIPFEALLLFTPPLIITWMRRPREARLIKAPKAPRPEILESGPKHFLMKAGYLPFFTMIWVLPTFIYDIYNHLNPGTRYIPAIQHASGIDIFVMPCWTLFAAILAGLTAEGLKKGRPDRRIPSLKVWGLEYVIFLLMITLGYYVVVFIAYPIEITTFPYPFHDIFLSPYPVAFILFTIFYFLMRMVIGIVTYLSGRSY